MSKRNVDVAPLGPERITISCETCQRRWVAVGTLRCREALHRAQKHADRAGHPVHVERINPR